MPERRVLKLSSASTPRYPDGVTKVRRITLRAAGGLAVLFSCSVLLCLDGIDYQPYFITPYYTGTTERLFAQGTNAAVVRQELQAGFGRALLTPSLNAAQDEPALGRFRALPLAGYGSRKGQSATGVHDDLYVKAVAFRVAQQLGIMVSADALIIPREVTDIVIARVKRDLGLNREQVYLSATHTHASLGGWGEGMVGEAFAGPFQPGVRIWLADRIASAIEAAVLDLSPATTGHGRLAAPGFVRNRLVGPLGQVDSEFSYSVVKQSDGDLAVLGSYAAHATVLPSSVMEFSADYPGCWQRAVEAATGGMAMFLAGSVGSHAPVAGASGFDGAQRLGEGLASALLEQLPQVPLTNIITFGTLGVEVSLPPLHARLTDSLRLRPWLAQRLLPVGNTTFLQAFRLDQSVWVSTPCDFSGELALEIKDFCRARGFNAVITSFNGDYIGYVVPSRYYHLNGYEPRVMSFFGPNVPAYFNELIRTLVLHLTDDR